MIRLGVDLGARRVGLAICDAEEIVASPLPSIPVRTTEDAFAAVVREARERGAEEIVLGHPRNLDGRPGPASRAAEAFAERLRADGFAVQLWDERLTTAEAERALRAANLSRKERRPLIDSQAAQVVLRTYLEWCRRQRCGGAE